MTLTDWTSILKTWLPIIDTGTQSEKVQAARMVGSTLVVMSRELTPEQKACVLQAANLSTQDARQYEGYFRDITEKARCFEATQQGRVQVHEV